MGNIIKSAVECDSAYGIVCILASFIFFYATIRFVMPYIYKIVCKICNTLVATIRFVMPYIYKIVCKLCNTLVKYKDVHTKANVKDVSFDTDLHR